jgi:nucleoside phosphorylase
VTRRALFVLLAASLSLARPVAAAQKPAAPVVVLGVPAEVRDVEASAVEMEGAAVGQVCWQLGVPSLSRGRQSQRGFLEVIGDLAR